MFGFDAPKAIRTEVFATLPEKYLDGGRKRAHALEGPSFDRDGNLYFTDIRKGRILRAAPDGAIELVTEYDGEPNGLKIHKDGRIFVADHHHGIMLLDPASGNIETYLAGPDREHFKGVNDLVFASDGSLYFTDQGGTGLHDPSGRVYCLKPDGELICLVDTVPSPNGLVFNRSERVLYVAATRSNQIWLVPLTRKGGVSKCGLFVQLPCAGPDGMAADAEGNVAVAHPGLGIVWIFNRQGIPIYRVESCAGKTVLNIAYGGEGMRWLYITESDSASILRAEMPAPGQPMFSHS